MNPEKSMNGEQPAFPVTGNMIDGKTGYPYSVSSEGMTKREYFAAKAMQAFIGSDWREVDGESMKDFNYDTYAEWSVKAADALLAELSKPIKP